MSNEQTQVQITFHWGKWVASDNPVPGVVAVNSLEWIGDETTYHAVANLSYDGYLEEYLREKTARWQSKQTDPDASPDADLIEKWTERAGDQYEESGDTYLIGSWSQDDNGQWEVNRDHDLKDDDAYAAVVNYDWGGGIVTVMWSRFVTRCALCSPCCPGQGDLDNEGEYLAFDLPLSIYGEYRQNKFQPEKYTAPLGEDDPGSTAQD